MKSIILLLSLLLPCVAFANAPYQPRVGGIGDFDTLTAQTLSSNSLTTQNINSNTITASSAINASSFSTLNSILNSNNNLGIGTTSPTSAIQFSGNRSQAAWATNGILINQDAVVFTDNTSSGTVAAVAINTFRGGTIGALSSTTYTLAATLRCSTPPAAGSNVAITQTYCFHTLANNRFDGLNGFGGITPTASVHIIPPSSSASWSTTGVGMAINAQTINDTTGSGTIGVRVINSIAAATLTSTSSETLTRASTLYIGGPPIASTNVTITKPLALSILSGDVELQNGNVTATSFSGAGTGLTGTAPSLTAGTVTTNANLNGVITSVGNTTSIASQTGTGTKFVVDTSPTIITPTLSGATNSTGNLIFGTNAHIQASDGAVFTYFNQNFGMYFEVSCNCFNFQNITPGVRTVKFSADTGAMTLTQAGANIDIQGDYTIAGVKIPESASTGLTLTGSVLTSNAVYQVDFQTGILTAISNTKSAFRKISKTSTVDNIEVSAMSFTCAVNPTVTFYECGTSSTCTSPTTIGSATLTTSGTVVDGTISSSSITAGDYVAWAITAGTCTNLNLSASAQVHSN